MEPFPRNSWSICEILILNSNQEICLLHRFYGYEVLALFLKCGRKGSTGSTHGGKISVTPPPTNPKTLTDVNASRVPELGCGWKNLPNRWRPVTQVLLGFYLGHVCAVHAFFNCVELRQNTAKNTKIIEMSKLVQKRLGSTYGKYIAYISPSYIE